MQMTSWRSLSAKEGGEHFPLKKEKFKENGFEVFLKDILKQCLLTKYFSIFRNVLIAF